MEMKLYKYAAEGVCVCAYTFTIEAGAYITIKRKADVRRELMNYKTGMENYLRFLNCNRTIL